MKPCHSVHNYLCLLYSHCIVYIMFIGFPTCLGAWGSHAGLPPSVSIPDCDCESGPDKKNWAKIPEGQTNCTCDCLIHNRGHLIGLFAVLLYLVHKWYYIYQINFDVYTVASYM